MKRFVAAAFIGLLPGFAFAQQQQQQIDPRIVPSLVQSLQAQLAFAKTVMQTQETDVAALKTKLCSAIAPDKIASVSECPQPTPEQKPE